MPEDAKMHLLKQIQNKMTPHPLRIKAFFEITCFTYEGIDAIKASLIAAENDKTFPDCEIKVFSILQDFTFIYLCRSD